MTTEMISQKPEEEFMPENDNDETVVNNCEANGENEAKTTDEVPTYADAFPPLSAAATNGNSAPVVSKWNSNNKMSVKSSNVTKFFCIPYEKQSNGDSKNHAFAICKRVAQQDNVSIEISQAKDESLTLVIVGKPADVAHAKKSLVQRLQTQVSQTVKVPKEVHRFILGVKGARLSQLELKTSTRIQLPHRNDENGEDVVITGSEEGVRVARHEIEVIRDQQALVSIEKLPIKRNFQPFICGVNNKKINELGEKYGVRITNNPEEIIVSGDKEKVNKVKQIISSNYESIVNNCDTVDIQIEKSQHRYLIGSKGRNLNEILEETGVSVEMPPQNSSSETVRLRGDRLKLGAAISAVYSKANSVVTNQLEAPSYLHRLIIGKKGENVKKITENLPNVHIDFDGDLIKFVGAPEQVVEAREELEKQIKLLKTTHAFEEVEIDRKIHPHIVGKAGANVNRLKNEYNVNIRIPHDNTESNTVIIEGDPQGVISAKEELLDMANKLGNEKSRDIIIPHNLHRLVIGTNGSGIQLIRKDYPNVMINFPAAKVVSDIVTLRGNKDEVNACYTYLTKYVAQLVLNNYTLKVHIFHEYHKYIIGKSGSNLKKICEETSTKINLPNRDSTGNDVIVVTGLQKNAEKARDMLEAIQKEYADIKEETIEVPHDLHTSMIGPKGALIRSISNNCGGVIVNFPTSKVKSDKVVIRGPEENVKKAKEQLLALSSELSVASACKREIRGVNRELHPFLIGRGGANVNKLRDQTGARIFFVADDEGDYIQLIGTEEQVDAAMTSLQASIKRLENHAEEEVEIDQKHHRYFLLKRGEQIQKISDEFGGVSISFPKVDSGNTVRITGPKECVSEAKEKILSIVKDLDSQVTIDCEIDQVHHRSILSNRGAFVQELTTTYNVNVNFPKRVNNNAEDEENDDNSANIITISGPSDNCEKVKELLLARVPVSREIVAPYQFHRYLIGQKGKDLREFMSTFDVNVAIPPANNKTDSIKITGVSTLLDAAIAEMEDRIAKLQFKADNERTIVLVIKHDYHPKIIGRRGTVISKIRDERHVQIQFPDKGCPEDEIDIVKVSGQSEEVQLAEKDIMAIVEQLESLITHVIVLDSRIHARIIGQKGRGIRKIMEDFKVDVKFGRDSDEVSITGEEESVLDCKDYLFNLEDEFMQDVNDYELNVAPSRRLQQEQTKTEAKSDFVVRNAPWTTNSNDFPAFGEQNSDSQGNGWGRGSP